MIVVPPLYSASCGVVLVTHYERYFKSWVHVARPPSPMCSVNSDMSSIHPSHDRRCMENIVVDRANLSDRNRFESRTTATANNLPDGEYFS